MLTGQGRGHLPARQSGHFHLSRLLPQPPALAFPPPGLSLLIWPCLAIPKPSQSPHHLSPLQGLRGRLLFPNTPGQRQAEAPLPTSIIPGATESASNSPGKLIPLWIYGRDWGVSHASHRHTSHQLSLTRSRHGYHTLTVLYPHCTVTHNLPSTTSATPTVVTSYTQ